MTKTNVILVQTITRAEEGGVDQGREGQPEGGLPVAEDMFRISSATRDPALVAIRLDHRGRRDRETSPPQGP